MMRRNALIALIFIVGLILLLFAVSRGCEGDDNGIAPGSPPEETAEYTSTPPAPIEPTDVPPGFVEVTQEKTQRDILPNTR